ncbi:hypothetical protein AAZX31_08G029900 [Glycine max]
MPVIKSELEIALIQYANDISSEAHVEVMRNTKAGMKEYQLESIFLHHTCMYGGCWHCSYTCICATGDNSAVLHYGHAAAPNDKVNGKFTSDQSLIYSISRKSDSGVTEEGTHFIGVITVEPGCYFIDALLLPAMNSPETSEFLNQEAINRFKCFGGVRIESDVLVTGAGCYNMS